MLAPGLRQGVDHARVAPTEPAHGEHGGRVGPEKLVLELLKRDAHLPRALGGAIGHREVPGRRVAEATAFDE